MSDVTRYYDNSARLGIEPDAWGLGLVHVVRSRSRCGSGRKGKRSQVRSAAVPATMAIRDLAAYRTDGQRAHRVQLGQPNLYLR